MALDVDRLLAPFFALVRAALPRFSYYAPRVARVVKVSTNTAGETELDVVPEDPAFPPMGGIPLFHGLPGFVLGGAAPVRDTRVLVEFSEGDPARPFVRSWGTAGSIVQKATLQGDEVFVGGETGAEPPLKGNSANQATATFLVALSTYASAIKGTADPSNAATPALLTAIADFEAALPGLLAAAARVA